MTKLLDKKIIAQNRRARFDYHIEDIFEAGIVLTGSEVKSLRLGKANIGDAYCDQIKGDMYLLNAHIPEYVKSNRFNHETKRPRKLLLHRKQINKLIGKIKIKGFTVIALSIYINQKNLMKVEIALAKGKKEYDKRQTEKDRDWQREKSRIMKE